MGSSKESLRSQIKSFLIWWNPTSERKFSFCHVQSDFILALKANFRILGENIVYSNGNISLRWFQAKLFNKTTKASTQLLKRKSQTKFNMSIKNWFSILSCLEYSNFFYAPHLNSPREWTTGRVRLGCPTLFYLSLSLSVIWFNLFSTP